MTEPEHTDEAVSGRSRASRDEPERTRPYRGWWGFFRPWEDAARGAAGAGRGNGEGPLQSVVDRGVELGYKVIDEQIRQGQRAAREFSSQTYGPQSVNRDLQELVFRSLRYYVDMAGLWMDFLGSVPGSLGAMGGPFWRNAGRWQPPPPEPAPPAAGGAASGGAEVAVRLSRPARVDLRLEPGAGARELRVPALMASEKGLPPITEVVYEAAAGGGGPALRVAIDDGHPPGSYCGVVFDAVSGVPCGTLRVDLHEPAS